MKKITIKKVPVTQQEGYETLLKFTVYIDEKECMILDSLAEAEEFASIFQEIFDKEEQNS